MRYIHVMRTVGLPSIINAALFALSLLVGSVFHAVEAMPAPLSIFSGEVIDSSTGKNIPGVQVQIDYEGLKPETTTTDARGKFKWMGYAPGPNWIVTAEVPGATALPVLLQSSRYYMDFEDIKIYALPPKLQRLRVVSPSGQPVSHVQLTCTRYRFAFQTYWIPGDVLNGPTGEQAVTDADGWATLNKLPAAGIAEITTSHPQYASGIYPVDLNKQETVLCSLYPRTTIHGRVTLGDGQPLPGVEVTTGAWTFQGNGLEQRRTARTDKDGRYIIEDLPPLEVMGRNDLPIDIESGRSGFGIVSYPTSTSYTRWQGLNILLRTNQDGKREQWLYYATKPGEGMHYTPGEAVEHNLRFEPMALLTGKIPNLSLPAGGLLPRITYDDPRSANGKGQTIALADGTFSLPVPVGEVTVQFPQRRLTFKNLKAQEVRTVQWPK